MFRRRRLPTLVARVAPFAVVFLLLGVDFVSPLQTRPGAYPPAPPPRKGPISLVSTPRDVGSQPSLPGAAGPRVFAATLPGNSPTWIESTFLSKLRPPARCCFSMAYDPADHEVVMFGGARADGNRSNACSGTRGCTRAACGPTWTPCSLSVSPPHGSTRRWSSMPRMDIF